MEHDASKKTQRIGALVTCVSGMALLSFFIFGASATKSNAEDTSANVKMLSATKANCYIHHNCPADGIIPGGPYTKQQCMKLTNKNGKLIGMSWGNGPTDCSNRSS